MIDKLVFKMKRKLLSFNKIYTVTDNINNYNKQ